MADDLELEQLVALIQEGLIKFATAEQLASEIERRMPSLWARLKLKHGVGSAHSRLVQAVSEAAGEDQPPGIMPSGSNQTLSLAPGGRIITEQRRQAVVSEVLQSMGLKDRKA